MKEIPAKERITRYLSDLLLRRTENLMGQSSTGVTSVYEKARDLLARSNNKTISKIYLQSRSFKRSILRDKYSFVTTNELVVWTAEWLRSFPTTHDLIVGIPRSGLLVATLISLKFAKPLTTPELFAQNRYWVSEWLSERINEKAEYKNILLVDDSINTGKTMEEAFRLLCSTHRNFNITKAALIGIEDSGDLVDLCYKAVSRPRVFEWNMLHAKKGKLASDLDGVICENCPPGVDSDEMLYTEWIRTARPYLIPVFEIDAIVSSRLEKYRSDTEKWLARQKVRYRELILWDIESKQQRNGKHAKHKIEHLLRIKPDIFWESSVGEAKQVWEATKIPTLCIDEMILLS